MAGLAAPEGSGGAPVRFWDSVNHQRARESAWRRARGDLVILEIQPPGKKKMDAEAFARGYPCRPGLVLGEGA